MTWTRPPSILLPENIPSFLKAYDRWVVWEWEPRPDPTRKWTKRPKHPRGTLASTTDPKTWSSFDEVEAAWTSGQWDGIGIVLPGEVVGVDLDDCVVNREPDSSAEFMLNFLGTYAEYSPSGTGLKLLALGNVEGSVVSTSRGIEIYGKGSPRYFTITGDMAGPINEVRSRPEELAEIISTMKDPEDCLSSDELAEGEVEEQLEKAQEYLAHLPESYADSYSSWTRVGMALKTIGPEAFETWDRWSQGSTKYDGQEETLEKWDSFRRASGRMVTLHSLQRMAQKQGFRPDRYRTGAISADVFCRKVILREYVVEDFLVRGEPMVFGGGVKSLKTSIALDLAISMATGTDFLGHFKVPKPVPIMVISGESGEKTLQENLMVMAQARGLTTDQLHRVFMSFTLPKLDSEAQVRDLLMDLRKRGIEYVILDPLYRSLRVGDSASNVYAMGERLEQLSMRIHRAGVTPILCHHFRKQGATFTTPPELEDFSQAGVAEFCRQHLLLKRMESYSYDGKHSLWFRWGGSAGHQGAGVFQADTGTRNAGLKWVANFKTQLQWEEEQKEAKEMEKDLDRKAREESEQEFRVELLGLIETNPAMNTTELKALSGQSARAGKALRDMVRESVLEEVSGARNSKSYRKVDR